MYVLAVILAIAGSVVYHLSIKFVPSGVNPFLSLSVSYGIALLLCLPGIYLYEGSRNFQVLNWSVAGVALGMLGIEIGFLLLYRAGGHLGVSSLLTNAASTLLLLPIGLLFFREAFSVTRLLGMGIALCGLWLMMPRK
ncbi:MAG: EamA family transporter [Aeromonas popoffii]|jgi:drug/metabolite transporter (DMT)-like permease|uniref:EamA family transporter n=1 Tax=Aeromonas popoffii TaxID=70856 RepID=A0ABS5GTE8_9GAMM|nr:MULTISPECIES: EamA family transporter [Aeromonas]MBR7630317.1 EamA family transporter [Aeromonas popoffii]MDF2412800.1 EamA family transporter [Aeromonas sp. 1HA1]